MSTINCSKTSCSKLSWLKNLNFTNMAIKSLPVEKSPMADMHHTSRQVKNAVFSKAKPSVNLINPKLVSVSFPALKLLDASAQSALCTYQESDQFIKYFSGSQLLPGSEPHSHCYCGHQFGVFAGQLGDGTNTYLGDLERPKTTTRDNVRDNVRDDAENDENFNFWSRIELQLKGSGKTPYSRGSDGKKVLRSSIREFLCSENMHALGIPTTRAATVVTSFKTLVERHDHARIFNPENLEKTEINKKDRPSPVKSEPAAIISRLAPTFLRFGSFEIVKSEPCELSGKASNNPNDKDLLKSLVHYTAKNFFKKEIPDPDDYQQLLNQTTILTAKLVAKWNSVGFCHGVLNTDNMSILGLTIDYGPFGFMDYFDNDYVCNYSDHNGRYSYANQKDICEWNLKKLEDALNEDLEKEDVCFDQNLYQDSYKAEFGRLMQMKLGLQDIPSEETLEELFSAMGATRADFTGTFLILEEFSKSLDSESAAVAPVATASASDEKITVFSKKLAKISQSPASVKRALEPILNNHQLISTIRVMQSQKIPLEYIVGPTEAKNVQKQIERIIKMQNLTKLSENEKFENDLKVWSKFLEKFKSLEKTKVLGSFRNPKIVLRNYLAQKVILEAEKGNFDPVNELLEKLLDPFNEKYNEVGGRVESSENEELGQCKLVPGWAETMCVSCSS